MTLLMLQPVVGLMLKLWLAPELTLTPPTGVIEPPEPAEAVMVKVEMLTVKVALMEWFAVTLLKVYELTAPTEEPSTVTLLML